MGDIRNELKHYGVLGMKWGVRRYQNTDGSLKKAGEQRYLKGNGSQPRLQTIRRNTTRVYDTGRKNAEKVVYRVGAKLNPREAKYQMRKMINRPNITNQLLADYTQKITREAGALPTEKKALKAVETMGIEKHKAAIYNNLDKKDISRLKTYTDSARYSRNINSFLATGEPKDYEQEAKRLKQVLSKNSVSDTTVYRSCNMQFSIDGITNKVKNMSSEELEATFSGLSKNFAGKSRGETRVFSTSTSPLFAIDTWREVNPTAASTYNTYMVINTKNCPGVLADGKTGAGGSLVNTKSNQEAILAPDKLVYRRLDFDKDRGMFVIEVDAIGIKKK